MAKDRWRTYRYPARFGWLYEIRRESAKGHPESVPVSNLHAVIFFLVFAVILVVGIINFING